VTRQSCNNRKTILPWMRLRPPLIIQALFIGLLAAGCTTPTSLPTGFPVSEQTPRPATETSLAIASPTSLPALVPIQSATPTAASEIFPLPTAIPVEVYPTPPVEEMVTLHPDGSAWTTYIPPEWQERSQENQGTPTIVSIVATGDGSLWFASMGGARYGGTGVYRFNGQAWTHYTTDEGLPSDETSAMVVAPDGALWFSTLCCGVSRYDGRSWMAYTSANGLASNDVRSMAVAPDGALWFGTGGNGVSRFDGRNWDTYTTQNGLSGSYVGHISTLPDGSLMFSTSDGSRASLDRFDGQNWFRYPTEWTGKGKYTEDIAFSPHGDLWFATESDGIYRLAGGTWTHYTTGDGLAGESTRCGVVASDGAVWFGTDQGVSRFDGKSWTTFTTRDGLASNWINALDAAPDGSIWVGEAGGISRYRLSR
jgi:ligand-binding sensor domain-containing protein